MATQATDSPVTVRAQARWVRTSARKARLVLEHVRGKRYAQAHAALTFSTRAVSRDILQVLESAAALRSPECPWKVRVGANSPSL